jgi:CRISPR-associated Cas5-like protein
MSEAIRIICYGLTNGFRTPLSHSVQDTLPLPTPTNLIGLVGSAMGIGRSEIEDYYYKFKVGVVGTHTAMYQDLTHFTKYKYGGDIKERVSLLYRENLYDNHFVIWVIPSTKDLLDEAFQAFISPKFALSLGRDDEIIRIDHVDKVFLETANDPVISYTVVPFKLDPKEDQILDSDEILIPLVSMPLPRAFKIRKDNSRIPVDFNNYTFIERYRIRTKKEGALSDGEYIFYAL